MRFIKFLTKKTYQIIYEWIEKWQYAGRAISGQGKTYVWIYITKPNQIGLVWSDPKGNIYKGSEKLYTFDKFDDVKATHKQILAPIFNKLSFDKNKLTDNFRNDIMNIVDGDYTDSNPRGRVVDDTLYIYPSSPMNMLDERRYKKLAEKAIKYVYKYIPSEGKDK